MLGSQITVKEVDFTFNDNTLSNTQPVILGPNEASTFSITGLPTLTIGLQYSGTVSIIYTWQGQTKFDNGVVSGKVT